MTHSRSREDAILMEGLLAEYYPEQIQLGETLRTRAFDGRQIENERQYM